MSIGRPGLFAFFSMGLIPFVTYGQAIPNRETTYLVFNDRSVGAVPLAVLWQGVAAANNCSLLFSTTEADFMSKLNGEPWCRVVVLRRKSVSEPSFAGALRTYAATHPNRGVEIFTWRDNGEPTAEGEAVLGTTAITLWRNGMTTTAYSLAANPLAENVRAHTTPNHTFPDFAGIQIGTLKPIASYTETVTEGVLQIVQLSPDPCQTTCVNTFVTEMGTCSTNVGTHTGYCNDTYGPTEDDPGDPAQYAACLIEAAQDYANCVSAALHRYNRCIQWCKGRIVPGPSTQPAP